ncbi:MAG: hypothetical protein ACLP07_05025 [Terracidiphilus sp.]
MAFTIITSITAAAEPQTSSDDSGKKAIDICMEAWTSAHDDLAEDEDSKEYECEKAGNKAYLKAVPSLSGYKNICDFIACINYASMTGVVTHNEAAHYLANARIALSTIYHQPKPISGRGPGRPKKSHKKRGKINN